MPELFIEIGAEEIPAGEVMMAVEFLEARIKTALTEARLSFGASKIYATPRRLAVQIADVQEAQADLEEEKSGPPVSFAFKDGKPTKAAEGFAKGLGLTVAELGRKQTKKGEYLSATVKVKGERAAALLPDIIATGLAKIPFKRRMRWGDGEAAFVRPLQWMVALFGDAVLPVSYAGIEAGRMSRGHRFLAPQPFEVTGGDQYQTALAERKVIVDVDERRAEIVRAATRLAKQAGAHLQPDDELIDEVVQLVEYPVAMLCSFDEKYLAIPDQVLISEMREHQRYLALVDENKRLVPQFIVIGNTIVRDPEVVKGGYQRVLAARFSDGVFFYTEDQKTKLIDRVDALGAVQFHRALGSIADKVARSVSLAGIVARALGDQTGVAGVPDCGVALGRPLLTASEPRAEADRLLWQLNRAGFLMKTDLVTLMVYEFPDLQGVMGRAYATIDGESAAVAAAIEEHYQPRNAQDDLPAGVLGAVLGIADRLDTMAGIFATGKGPTGAADPFGLRRAALAIINILRDKGWHVDLFELIDAAVAGIGDLAKKPAAEVSTAVRSFFRGRLKGVLTAGGATPDVAEAVLAVGYRDVLETSARAAALGRLRDTPDFEPIGVAFKRVANILKGVEPGALDPQGLDHPAEKALYAAVESVSDAVAAAVKARDYDAAFSAMASVRPPVDHFFDPGTGVMVNDPDPVVRARRQALVGEVQRMFAPLADMTKLN